MHALGIHTGADLKAWPLDELEREFGKSAGYYYRAARGVDHRPVSTSRTRRSIGSERTFTDNLLEREQMLEVMTQLGDELLSALSERQLVSATVSIKVRFGDFETLTRAYSHAAGNIDKSIFDRVLPYLLDRGLLARRVSEQRRATSLDARRVRPGVRLLGVTFSALSESDAQAPRQLEIDI